MAVRRSHGVAAPATKPSKQGAMATYKRGILGRFSGKVGTVVGATWRGISVMRAVPSEVRNPRTPKQQAQRERFQLMSRLLRLTRPFIQAGFEIRSSDAFTAANAMMSYNVRFGVKGEYPGQTPDWPNVRFAMGSLQGADAGGSSIGFDAESSEAVFTWADNSGQNNALSSDLAMLMLFNPDKEQAVFDTAAAAREAGTAMLRIPPAYAGDTLHAWIAFRRAEDSEERISSDSLYLGTLSFGSDNSGDEGSGDVPGSGENGNDDSGGN